MTVSKLFCPIVAVLLIKVEAHLTDKLCNEPQLFIGANPRTTPKRGWKAPRRGGKLAEGVRDKLTV